MIKNDYVLDNSAVLTQTTLANTPMPISGEIDLMKYSDHDLDAASVFLRSIAADDDVKGLIWLSRVKFDA